MAPKTVGDSSQLIRVVRDSIAILPPKPLKAQTIGAVTTNTLTVGGVPQPKILQQDFASGPPGNANDGDIWIATKVDGNGTVWQFRFNAGSTSPYRWEFIGGPPLVFQGTPQSTLTANVFTTLTIGTFTASRAGEYLCPSSGAYGAYASIANSTIEIGIMRNSTPLTTMAARSLSNPPSSFDWNLPGQPVVLPGIAAGDVLGMWGYNNSTGYIWSAAGYSIIPKRII